MDDRAAQNATTYGLNVAVDDTHPVYCALHQRRHRDGNSRLADSSSIPAAFRRAKRMRINESCAMSRPHVPAGPSSTTAAHWALYYIHLKPPEIGQYCHFDTSGRPCREATLAPASTDPTVGGCSDEKASARCRSRERSSSVQCERASISYQADRYARAGYPRWRAHSSATLRRPVRVSPRRPHGGGLPYQCWKITAAGRSPYS